MGILFLPILEFHARKQTFFIRLAFVTFPFETKTVLKQVESRIRLEMIDELIYCLGASRYDRL